MNGSCGLPGVTGVREARANLPRETLPVIATVVGSAKVCDAGDQLALAVEAPDVYADPEAMLAPRLRHACRSADGATTPAPSPAPVDWAAAIATLPARWQGVCRFRRWRDHQSVTIAGQFLLLRADPTGDLTVSTVPFHCAPSPEVARWARRVHSQLRLVQVAWQTDQTLSYRVLLPSAPFRGGDGATAADAVAAAVESLAAITQVLPPPAVVADRAFARLLAAATAGSPLSVCEMNP